MRSDPALAKKRADSLRGMVQHANPLMLGSVANKAFAADFWKWAQEGNVQPAQLQEFSDLMNTYQKTLFASGLSRERFEVPEKGAPISREKRGGTIIRDLVREAIRKENVAKTLMAR